MFTVPHNNSLPAVMQPQGLQGYSVFGKLWRKAAGAIIKAAGSYLAGLASTYSGGIISEAKANNWFAGIADKVSKGLSFSKTIDITSSEQAILQAWVENKLKPWLEIIVKEVGATANMTPSAQLAALSAVINKIDLASDYYATNADGAGLSELGLEQRQGIFYALLYPVHDGIMQVVFSLDQTYDVATQTITFAPTKYNMAPLFTSTPLTSVTSKVFSIAGTAALPTAATPVKAGTGIVKSSLVAGGTVLSLIKGGTIPAATTTLPVATTTVITTPTGGTIKTTVEADGTTTTTTDTPAAATDSTGMSSGKKVALAFGLGALAYLAYKSRGTTKAATRKTPVKAKRANSKK